MTRKTAGAPGKGRLILLILLSLAGAWVSYLLTQAHVFHGGQSGGLFGRVCQLTGDGCSGVLRSPYSMLPGGLPVALLGLVYFAALAIWYAVVGTATRERRSLQLPILILHVLGALGSLFWLGVMVFQLGSVCGWCLLTHVINLVALWLAVGLWRGAPSVPAGRERPSTRLAVAGALLMLAVAALAVVGLRGQVAAHRLAEAGGRLQAMEQDLGLQAYLHQRSGAVTIPMRADDPVEGAADAPHTVVVFSDFECPGCRGFARSFEQQIEPEFGDRVRVVFKHFPINNTCNSRVDGVLHERACEAAYAAETAREMGGNEAFWRMHDAIFASPEDLVEGDWESLARAAGLPPEAVVEGVRAQTGRDRIAADADAGAALGFNSTPAVYVDGRAFEGWNRPELWRAVLAAPAPTSGPAPASAPAPSSAPAPAAGAEEGAAAP